jgi:hypothetical protein
MLRPQIDNRDNVTASVRPWIAISALFCRRKRVRYSDLVKYSDAEEDAIEIPRIFVELREDCS